MLRILEHLKKKYVCLWQKTAAMTVMADLVTCIQNTFSWISDMACDAKEDYSRQEHGAYEGFISLGINDPFGLNSM